jgi:hypothetical protein
MDMDFATIRRTTIIALFADDELAGMFTHGKDSCSCRARHEHESLPWVKGGASLKSERSIQGNRRASFSRPYKPTYDLRFR